MFEDSVFDLGNRYATHEGFFVAGHPPTTEPGIYAVLAAGLGLMAWIAWQRKGQEEQRVITLAQTPPRRSFFGGSDCTRANSG